MIPNFYKYDLQITNNPNYDKDVSNIQIRTMEMLNRHTGQDTYYLVHEHEIVAGIIPSFGKNN